MEQPNVKELNVSAVAMEQLLKFVYTGELDGIVELGVGQLAAAYQIKPLEDLCEFASHDVDEDEMAELAMQLKSGGQRVIWYYLHIFIFCFIIFSNAWFLQAGCRF